MKLKSFFIIKLSTFLHFLATLVFLGCHNGLIIPESKSIEQASNPELPTDSWQDRIIQLSDLDENSSEVLWEQFFSRRGGVKIWEVLQEKKEEISVNFSALDNSIIIGSERANEIGEGIVYYLSHHNSNVKKLELIHGRRLWVDEKYSFGNQLTNLALDINRLNNLTELNLERNQLTVLPLIDNLENLTTLKLKYNQLKEFPSSIANLRKLTTLDLKGNQLGELPPSIGSLTKLKELNLRRNKLKQLPEEIRDLTNLTVLDLDHNHFSELPASIGYLTRLEKISLRHNQLSSIPPASISNLVDLKGLYLSHNRITYLAPFVSELPQLEDISVDRNQLSVLPGSIASIIFDSSRDFKECESKLTNNPWINFEKLTYLGGGNYGGLKTCAYGSLPRSLVSICTRFLEKAMEVHQPEITEVMKGLPEELQLDRLYERKNKEYRLIGNGENIVYFKLLDDEFKEINQRADLSTLRERVGEQNETLAVPVCWDQEICTPQNIQDMLESLKSKDIFLISEDTLQLNGSSFKQDVNDWSLTETDSGW